MVEVNKIKYYLNDPLMKRIVELKERGFADKDEYDEAPVNYDDAIENYKRILDITADVAATVIEPNSESVDLEGPHLENGRMIYASKTYENLDATRKAGLWGAPFRRSQPAYHRVLHAVGAGLRRRLRLPERMVAAELHRHAV